MSRVIAEGRLELAETLGEGGMATVVRARDLHTGASRAVKLLAPRLAKNASVRARFRTEAELMQRLDHPHIVKVLDFGEDAGLFWIEMELVGGRNLLHWTHEYGPMPPRLAVEALLPVADALSAAHSEGIVHRDLKPENLLVDAQGRCRIVDFGIARFKDGMGMTRTGLTMGSAGYMAPEQISDAKRVDERADVYSLAVTLAVLVANLDPRDLDEVLRVFSHRVPQSLAMAVVRATASDRDHRTATMERFGRALARSLGDLAPIPPRTPGLFLPLS
ncbi:MAG TPA: serine/threonine-protein kinase [Myxococcota bacterium]|nr:serine/threonine-protein kinase [Myxococcota bacterium]